MVELEEVVLSKAGLKPYLRWRYKDDIFFLWEHAEEKLEKFTEHLNEKQPTIKFTTNWSQTSIESVEIEDVMILKSG